MKDIKAVFFAAIIAFMIVAGCTDVEYIVESTPTEVINTTTDHVSVSIQPTEIPTAWPTPLVKIIPVVVPTPVAVSTTSARISLVVDHNPALSLTHTGSVNIITGGWGTGAEIHVNSTNPDLKETVVEVPPDGKAVSLPLEPGNYLATLPDKLDNLSERHEFSIGDNAITYVAFNGYTYRVSNGEGC
jgi:hypothetical protein